MATSHGTQTGSGWRSLGLVGRVVAVFAICAVSLALLIAVLAHLVWRLPGVAAKVTREQVEAIALSEGIPTSAYGPDGKRLYNYPLGDWHGPRKFHQSPYLDAAVATGKIPPVDKRLPEAPLVMQPFELVGKYGGTWQMYQPDAKALYTTLATRHSYEYLLRWSTTGDEVLPNIAYLPEVSEGGRVFTVRLHKGIRWSDGVELTADDIMFWYEDVLLNKEITPSPLPFFKQGEDTVKVEKVDQYTVRFRFKQPNGLFYRALAFEAGGEPLMYPKHYLKQFHKDYVDEAVLTAKARERGFEKWYQLFNDRSKPDFFNAECPRLWPWIFTGQPSLSAQSVTLVRNPYYWKVDPEGNQLPYLDEIRCSMLDKEVSKGNTLNGDFGFDSIRFRVDEYPMIMEHRNNEPLDGKRRDYRVGHWPNGLGAGYTLCLNQYSPDPVLRAIFQDKRFRYALSYAINREEIRAIVYGGFGEPRQECPPKASIFYDEAYAKAFTEFSPAKANALLDEMGLKRGPEGIRLRPDGQPLTITLESQILSAGSQALELVTDYWNAVGINTIFKWEQTQLFYQRKGAAQHDVAAFTGTEAMYPILDPRFFIPYTTESNQFIPYVYYLQSKGEKGQQPPAEVQRVYDLYQQIKQTIDENEQKRLWKEITDLNRENLWVIGLIGELPDICMAHNTIRNVPPVAVTGFMFRHPGNIALECLAYDPNGKKGW